MYIRGFYTRKNIEFASILEIYNKTGKYINFYSKYIIFSMFSSDSVWILEFGKLCFPFCVPGFYVETYIKYSYNLH